MFRTTLYHPEHGARDVEYSDARECAADLPAKEREGWFDTPAKFGMRAVVKAAGRRSVISYEPIPGGNIATEEPEDVPALDGMSAREAKDKLEAWAKDRLGVDLDKRKSLDKLMKEVQELVNGTDHADSS